MAKQSKIAPAAWQIVETVPVKLKPLHDAMLASRKEAAAKREAFEAAFLTLAKSKGAVPEGQTLAFSHNFGRLSVALTADTGVKGEANMRRAFKL